MSEKREEKAMREEIEELRKRSCRTAYALRKLIGALSTHSGCVFRDLEKAVGADLDKDGKIGSTCLRILAGLGLGSLLLLSVVWAGESIRSGWANKQHGTFATYADDATKQSRLAVDRLTVTNDSTFGPGTVTVSGTVLMTGSATYSNANNKFYGSTVTATGLGTFGGLTVSDGSTNTGQLVVKNLATVAALSTTGDVTIGLGKLTDGMVIPADLQTGGAYTFGSVSTTGTVTIALGMLTDNTVTNADLCYGIDAAKLLAASSISAINGSAITNINAANLAAGSTISAINGAAITNLPSSGMSNLNAQVFATNAVLNGLYAMVGANPASRYVIDAGQCTNGQPTVTFITSFASVLSCVIGWQEDVSLAGSTTNLSISPYGLNSSGFTPKTAMPFDGALTSMWWIAVGTAN